MPVFGRLNYTVEGYVESYEVEEGLNKIKVEKAPGLDQCALEYIMKGGRSIVACLVQSFKCYFETGRVPRNWYRACTVTLCKRKEDRCVCSNSKDISMLSAAGKLHRRGLIHKSTTQTA